MLPPFYALHTTTTYFYTYFLYHTSMECNAMYICLTKPIRHQEKNLRSSSRIVLGVPQKIPEKKEHKHGKELSKLKFSYKLVFNYFFLRDLGVLVGLSSSILHVDWKLKLVRGQINQRCRWNNDDLNVQIYYTFYTKLADVFFFSGRRRNGMLVNDYEATDRPQPPYYEISFAYM